jgi:flagellar FliJ protein
VKRYRFRLEPVLRVRRIQEEAARADLLAATAAAADQEQQLRARSDAYESSCLASEVRSCADFLHEQSRRAAFAGALLEQRARVRAAQEDVVRARSAWSETASRVGALERLDERQRDEHRMQTQKEDDLNTDELVVARHGREDR